MKLFLHCCCAPCSVMCVEELQKQDFDLTLFWYNPNIHPLVEYKNRLDTFIEYAQKNKLKTCIKYKYYIKKFFCCLTNNIFKYNILENICLNLNNIWEFPNRCFLCYHMRLECTAKYARLNNFDAFSSTLLISPYQSHEIIYEIAMYYASKYDIEFIYKDFRSYFKEGQKKSRVMGFYMQKYCGCIFSEAESNKKCAKLLK
ncbi:MAG: hypothetical protein NkDv07_0032 [Candidatus Improbicoccus devescovinae]|nr:MAG: hypothetical protein NkDv07_0032 [Candidatus Improbicoccus devescovinae]